MASINYQTTLLNYEDDKRFDEIHDIDVQPDKYELLQWDCEVRQKNRHFAMEKNEPRENSTTKLSR